MTKRKDIVSLHIDFDTRKGQVLPMGISKTATGVNFSVLVPKGKEIELLIYEKGQSTPCSKISYDKGSRIGNLWAVELIDFQWKSYEYNYMLDGQIYLDPYGERFVGTENYGTYIQGADMNGEVRCGFAFDDFQWEDDQLPAIPMEKVVAYNLHVRGFTMDKSSKVNHPGTFAGVIEKIPYLQTMGINQIELMPAYEFCEMIPQTGSLVDPELKTNFWGYGPGYYFAPKTSYSYGDDPSIEFKALVKACHKSGIEMIMEFFFPEDITGSFLLDCLRYWAKEYHVDGFRINENHAPLKEAVLDPMLSCVKIYSTAFHCDKGNRNETLALQQYDFLDVSRRLLRGEENQIKKFAFATVRQWEEIPVLNFITEHNGFTLRDLVSYDQKHNETNGHNNHDGSDYNLSWNCGAEGDSDKEEIVRFRLRQMKNILAVLLLSKGTPMLLAGDELGNSQQGNNNAYCQDNEIGWVQWDGPFSKELQNYVQKMIHLRKEHDVLWSKDKGTMYNVRGTGYPGISFHGSEKEVVDMGVAKRSIGVMFWDEQPSAEQKEQKDVLYIAYNFYWLEQQLSLPKLPEHMEWCIIADTNESDDACGLDNNKGKKLENQENVNVPPRTVMILAGRQYEDK